MTLLVTAPDCADVSDTACIPMRFVTSALARLPRSLCDSHAVLNQIGLDPAVTSLTHGWVSARSYGKLWRMASTLLDDEFFGLDSRRMKPGTLAMHVRSVVTCRDLQHALERSLRFYGLILDDIGGTLSVDGALAAIELRSVNGTSEPSLFAHETLLTLILGVARWLVRRPILLRRAEFAFPKPPHSDDYRLTYGPDVVFSKAKTAVYFNADDLKLPVVQTVRTLKTFLTTAPDGLLLKHGADNEISRKIIQRFGRQIASNEIAFVGVAKALNVAPATLRRRLRSEGGSYRRLRDEVRLGSAKQHLSDPGQEINDIAHDLGFSERRSFERAFRRWTARSPAAHRRLRT